MQNGRIREDLILGLDIGANSIGWALIGTEKGEPAKIESAGARVFDEGINIDPKSGKNSSKNTDRREARSRRRILDRRVMRLRHLLQVLQRAGLLPEGERPSGIPSINERSELAKALAYDPIDNNPYLLRTRALDHPVGLKELGRILYHLAQRRGYQSNRRDEAENAEAGREKNEKKQKEELGKVKLGIRHLEILMEEAGARTVGEYLSRLDPHEQRIRNRYTARAMFEREFEAIWEAQAIHHPGVLTPKLKKQLRRAIFHQRPLKAQKELIGECELEAGRKRAPIALLLAQRVRLLQEVNHARVVEPGRREPRPLNGEERALLVEHLEATPKLKFKDIYKLPEWPRGTRLNLDAGGREFILGNITAGKIRAVMGEKWDALSAADRDQVVEDILSIKKNDALSRRGMKRWGLSADEADRFGRIALEDGYSRHSSKALRNLLPHLEAGLEYARAKIAAGYLEPEKPPADVLKPIGDLRNPIVQRALAEARRVLNRLISEHGKPLRIRIELARDLKKNAKEREGIWKKNRANERGREQAAQRIIKEIGNPRPSRADVEKVLLAEECDWRCPYTGHCFGIRELFGDPPRFEVEHIIPFSRSLDNSFMNKTLCETQENRATKRNRTPFEAYGHDAEKWKEMCDRVKKFKSDARGAKLDRFLLKDVRDDDAFIEEFSTRQLNDTRYASRKAAEYIGELYGSDWRKHIQVGRGQVTAYLRDVWSVNRILNDGGAKSREDHRHHAIDAIMIALTDARTVKNLSSAAARSAKYGRFARDETPPWNTFLADLREAISRVVVSHRVSRKVNGPLHQESFYGWIKVRGENGAMIERAVLRTRLEALTPADIRKNLIVDSGVRIVIHQKIAELAGVEDLSLLSDEEIKASIKMFNDHANHPFLPRKKDPSERPIPIRKVRVIQEVNPVEIGSGPRLRRVKLGGNHHLEIFRRTVKGKEVWTGEVVSRFEAMRRKRANEPIVRKTDTEGNPLVFSLAIGEAVELTWTGKKPVGPASKPLTPGERGIAVVANLSKTENTEEYGFRLLHDARKAGDAKRENFYAKAAGTLQRMDPQKLAISPLGEIQKAND